MYRTLAVLSLCFAVCLGQGIQVGPDNDAVYAGSDVELSCTASSDDHRVQWIEYVTTEHGSMISDGDYILPGHPNADRYNITVDLETNTYVLTIADTVVDDGGRYECRDERTYTSMTSQLVVIAGEPQCETTLPAGGIVVEGIHYTVECLWTFGASDGIAPYPHWTGPGDFNQINIDNPGSIESGIGFDVQKVMDAKSFRMTTNFTSDGFVDSECTNCATNIPDFYHTYNTMTLFVRYGPQDVSYSPVKSAYEVGEVLTCHADAVPLPTFMWTDMINNVDYHQQTLTTTTAMIGSAILRCQVTNVVSSANIFVNTTIFAKTTPPTPTTTPMPTTPPPVSNCLDLTGRWEYQRSADSKAVLCMYVDGDDDLGFIQGLFWNDTMTETYYMDIVGRTRNNIYDETGLVGIWPLDVGVSAFAIECHRCYGEETLLMNVVSRTSTDDEFCGDGGDIITGVEYEFQRVPWSYPCGKLTTVQELRSVSRQAALRRRKRRMASAPVAAAANSRLA
jgi:hypothetical protein